MCSNNSDAFQCLNGGYCSETNTCICASACFVGNYCEIEFNAAHLPLTGAIPQDLPEGRDVYIVIIVLFVLCGLVNNIFALTTFIRERIRISACGIYLILFSILGILLMITILTYIMTVVQYTSATYKVVACHAIPFISLIMVDGGFLFTVAIAVERVLIECFNFSIDGSRIRSSIVSFLIICYVAGTNIDEIFIRRMTTDASGREICIYDFREYPLWRRFDIVFSYTHIIFPWAAHFICSICVLTTIARRKIFIRSTQNRFCYVWFQQLYSHRDFFIPPICIVVCILPHAIMGHLMETCIPYTDKFKLRLHILFVFFLFVPHMLTFVLYVYPNGNYYREFQQTIFYRIFCCYCYRRRRRLRQQRLLQTENKIVPSEKH